VKQDLDISVIDEETQVNCLVRGCVGEWGRNERTDTPTTRRSWQMTFLGNRMGSTGDKRRKSKGSTVDENQQAANHWQSTPQEKLSVKGSESWSP
jgi:hypothetical protein